jgi:CHAT domain-containing protein
VAFLNAAPSYSSLFLACHGNVEPGEIDALAASRLELANGELLTAKDVFFKLSGLQTDLVFLNACASGRFQSRLSAEAGGFGPAFLRAGARSVISTMAHVDPGEAQGLAVEFYKRWLAGGTTKAAALQNAQLAMYRDGIAPISWGSYLLIGDYR